MSFVMQAIDLCEFLSKFYIEMCESEEAYHIEMCFFAFTSLAVDGCRFVLCLLLLNFPGGKCAENGDGHIAQQLSQKRRSKKENDHD